MRKRVPRLVRSRRTKWRGLSTHGIPPCLRYGSGARPQAVVRLEMNRWEKLWVCETNHDDGRAGLRLLAL